MARLLPLMNHHHRHTITNDCRLPRPYHQHTSLITTTITTTPLGFLACLTFTLRHAVTPSYGHVELAHTRNKITPHSHATHTHSTYAIIERCYITGCRERHDADDDTPCHDAMPLLMIHTSYVITLRDYSVIIVITLLPMIRYGCRRRVLRYHWHHHDCLTISPPPPPTHHHHHDPPIHPSPTHPLIPLLTLLRHRALRYIGYCCCYGR